MVKLIIGGASGFVGTEIIRQSLSNPSITAVYALARKPVAVPEGTTAGADTGKLKSLVVEDFEKYPEEVKEQLADADATIWYEPTISLRDIDLGEHDLIYHSAYQGFGRVASEDERHAVR